MTSQALASVHKISDIMTAEKPLEMHSQVSPAVTKHKKVAFIDEIESACKTASTTPACGKFASAQPLLPALAAPKRHSSVSAGVGDPMQSNAAAVLTLKEGACAREWHDQTVVAMFGSPVLAITSDFRPSPEEWSRDVLKALFTAGLIPSEPSVKSDASEAPEAFSDADQANLTAAHETAEVRKQCPPEILNRTHPSVWCELPSSASRSELLEQLENLKSLSAAANCSVAPPVHYWAERWIANLYNRLG